MKSGQVLQAMEIFIKNSEGEVTGGEITCYIEDPSDGTHSELCQILLTEVETVSGKKTGLVFKGRA